MADFSMKKNNHLSSDIIIDTLIYTIILVAVIITLYPFIYVMAVSFSSGDAINEGKVVLWPVGFNLKMYKMVFQYDELWVSYANTIFYTIVGTIFNMVFTILAAFPLSRREFFLRKKLNFFIALTMYFSGGLIPVYIVVTKLGLYNTRWAMILPMVVSAFNIMICRSAFESISEEIFESAKIEGANDLQILYHVAVPLVKPTLAVLTLYYAVARYNDFFSALLYIGRTDLQPLQLFLRRILLMASTEIMQKAGSNMPIDAAALSTLQIRYVCIVIATLPILVITPFMQKYLVEGTMIGAVKG